LSSAQLWGHRGDAESVVSTSERPWTWSEADLLARTARALGRAELAAMRVLPAECVLVSGHVSLSERACLAVRAGDRGMRRFDK